MSHIKKAYLKMAGVSLFILALIWFSSCSDYKERIISEYHHSRAIFSADYDTRNPFKKTERFLVRKMVREGKTYFGVIEDSPSGRLMNWFDTSKVKIIFSDSTNPNLRIYRDFKIDDRRRHKVPLSSFRAKELIIPKNAEIRDLN